MATEPTTMGYAGERAKLTKTGIENILDHSISDRALDQALEGIDAGRFLMVVDACNSGQVLEAEEKRRGPMNSKGLAPAKKSMICSGRVPFTAAK